MKNLIILLIVVAGLLFAGKIFIEKRYESKLDDVIDKVRFFANVRYDNVKIDFDGSISLNGLSISSPQLKQSFDVQKIRAISSDRLMAFNGFSAFKNGKFPETFDLSITQMQVPVGDFERLARQFGQSSSNQCRDFSTSFNYARAGYSRLTQDVRVAVDFRDRYNSLISFDGYDETSSFELEAVFDASKVESVALGRSKNLPISEINIDYELDSEAAKQFVKHCADEFKLTPDDFLAKVVGSSKYSKNSFGNDFGPQVREALVKFMRGGSRLSLVSKPSSQLQKIEQLKFYKPKDILRWLNLTVSLDGEDLPLRESLLAAEKEAEAEAKDVKEESKSSKYTAISIGSADNYVGRWVQVTRTLGRKGLEGTLSGVSGNDRLMIEMYQHGGLMTLTVREDEIDSIKVLNK